VPCWADKAYQGAGGTVRVPYRGRWDKLSEGERAVNVSHAKIRAVGEQAMATLKSWRLLRKLRCSPTRITGLVKAVLTLHRRLRAERAKEPLCKRVREKNREDRRSEGLPDCAAWMFVSSRDRSLRSLSSGGSTPRRCAVTSEVRSRKTD
jgi:hypothetical protein